MRRLLTTLAAMMLLGVAAAQTSPDNEPVEVPGSVLSGVTVTCTLAAPSWTLGCWAERLLATVGPVELAVALDAGVSLSGEPDPHLAPMLSLAYYGEASSVWVEVAMPAGTVPGLPLGRGDWLRVGFSHRIP
jgi:hypothetical protein